MPTFLLVLVLAGGVAAGKLFTEVTAEYVAKYYVDNEDMGISKVPPVVTEPGAAIAGQPVIALEAVPVLVAASTGMAEEPPATDAAIAATTAGIAPETMSESAGESAAEAATGAASAPAHSPAGSLPAVAAIDAAVAPQAAEAEAADAEAGDAAMGDTEAGELSNNPMAKELLALIGDTPHRRGDGSVFLPIASQRIFGLRTALGERAQAPVTVELPGRVIPDPNTATLVQSLQQGIIEPIEGKLPFSGQLVRRGDLLAHLRPVFTALERAELDTRIQGIENEIEIDRKRMRRLEEVMFVRFRESKIEALRVEIAGLQRQLAVLRESLVGRQDLRAHTDGVISRVEVAAGEYVEPGRTLFEIVDPSRLWVTAIAFEPGIVDRIATATAITPEGRYIPLRFVGGGLTLRNQAIPLQFEMAQGAPGLSVETPVTVVVQTRSEAITGVRVPRSSLVRTNDGRHMVWERRTAETFVPHEVTTLPVDGESVLVVSELAPSLRVVTDGASVLTQIR